MDGITVFVLGIVMIALVVVMGIGLEVFRTWTRHREKMVGALNAQAAEKAAQYAAHNERLEARVQVLERIATDRGTDLSREIELLRDGRVAH